MYVWWVCSDLVEASYSLTRQLKVEQFRAEIRPKVVQRILEALTGPEVWSELHR